MGNVKTVETSGLGLIGATLGAAAIGAALVVTFWGEDCGLCGRILRDEFTKAQA
jgi:hypothetical protein